MATKKPATAKKQAAAPSVKPVTEPAVPAAAARKVVWTAPIALLMAIVAVGGLLIAARESSNAPSAATPAVTGATMAPSVTDGRKTPAEKPAAPAAASADTVTAPEAKTAAAAKPVSITGCLQRSGDGFQLKNAEGAAAPKSRSWKSGFLKRSASSIDLSDAANAAHLATHIGQRVTVTGSLVERDMRVLSLRRVAGSCE